MADSSSTSSSERPLGALALLAVVLATAVGLEVAARSLYTAPVPIVTKAEAFAAQVDEPGDQIIVIGTCLPEQTIQLDRLGAMVDPDTRVLNLAAPATGPQVWARVVDRFVPRDAAVRAIVLPYGPGELSAVIPPWENPTFELASWSDMPFLIEHSCTGPRCATDLVLRRASATWRYRERLATPFWTLLGTHGGIAPRLPSPARPDGPGLSDTGPPPGPTRADLAGHSRIDATGAPIRGREVAPGSELPAEVSAAGLGWAPEQDRIHYESGDPASLIWLEDFLAQAAERDIPVLLVPLPTRRVAGGGDPGAAEQGAYGEALRALLARPGVTRVELASAGVLRPEHFEDDVHLTPTGRQVATELLADRLREVLGTEQR